MDFTPQPGAKNRTTFILLGVLLGFFGAHSFYAGYRGRGFLQLAITLGTLGIGGIAIWIWAIIDICTISRDSAGINFRN
jgi:TM2 domain-containing membrane protein YozV